MDLSNIEGIVNLDWFLGLFLSFASVNKGITLL